MADKNETEGRHPAESKVEMREIVLPNDTNTHGNILGGKVLHMMDIAAAMVAIRHARRPVVTAAMDHVEFLNPIPEGHFVIVRACLNYTGRTSMEIGVKVLSENPSTGEERHTSSAYLTFVSLDDLGRPAPVVPVVPENDEERTRFEQGSKRSQARREHRQQS